MAKKKVAKNSKPEVEKSAPKLQHYFRVDKLEQKKKEGQKVVEIKDKLAKKLIEKNQDLVLMEK